MRISLLFVALLSSTLGAATAHAEIYRFLDDKGVWHYSTRRVDGRYKRWNVGHEKFELDDAMSEVLGTGPYDDIFVEAGKRTFIPPALLKAMAAQESGFNPKAISPKGAMGLMQLMPATAKFLQVANPFDPEESIHGGARYLRMLLDAFSNNMRLAVAAYNCGESPVRRVLDVPHIDETQDYVRRVMRFFASFGGGPLEEVLPQATPAPELAPSRDDFSID
jgi:Transglycosylase SLT domain